MLLVVIALVTASSLVLAHTDAILGVYGLSILATVVATISINRWYERYRLPNRRPRR
jgi:hypothetical protein